MKGLIGLIAFILLACSSRTRGIFFIPFDRQDVGEVTAQTIDSKAQYKWPGAPEKIRRELFGLRANPCDKPQSDFNSNSVRLKVDIDDGAFLVDSNGIALSAPYSCPANIPYITAVIRGLQVPADREKIRKYLESATGPTPWYSEHLQEFEVGQRKFHWVGKDHDTLTEVGVEKPLFVSNVYSRVFFAKTGYFGVFGKRAVRKGDGDEERQTRPFTIAIFEVANLKPIVAPPVASAKVNGGPPFFSESKPAETIEIPDALPAGTRNGFASQLIDETPELLFVADGPKATGEKADTSAAASIYVWRPKSGEIEVLPQNWFTGQMFDLGYQWITQVRRDPDTKKIIGSGIRLPDFELDDQGNLNRIFFSDR